MGAVNSPVGCAKLDPVNNAKSRTKINAKSRAKISRKSEGNLWEISHSTSLGIVQPSTYVSMLCNVIWNQKPLPFGLKPVA